MKTFLQNEKVECLNKLRKIQDFTKKGENFYIYNFLEENGIASTFIPVLKNAGIVKVHKKQGKSMAYIWNTIDPNIYMAEKTLQEIVEYNQKCLKKRKERLKEQKKQLQLSEQQQNVEEQDDAPDFTGALMNEVDRLFGQPISEIEDKPKAIALLNFEIERLTKLNTNLEHQLDYAKNVENREVQDELVKAMNLNSEKSLIIGNMAMQLDKKDDEIKLVSRLLDNNNALAKAIMDLQETIIRQEKLIASLNKTLQNITEKSNPPAKNFSILWGLLTIKNA